MTRTRRETDWKLFVHKNRGLLALMAITLMGVLIGAALVGGLSKQAVELLSSMTSGFITSRSNQSVVNTLGSSFFSAALLLMLAMLMGFSAISQPITVFIPLFRGMGLGFSMGYLYSAYGMKGVGISIVLMLPSAILSSLIIIIGCREALRLSSIFFRFALGVSKEEAVSGTIRLYLGKFAILFVFALVSSVVDALLTFLFAGLLIP